MELLTASQMRSVIWFLKPKNIHPAEIQRNIFEVCDEGAMNEKNVSKW